MYESIIFSIRKAVEMLSADAEKLMLLSKLIQELNRMASIIQQKQIQFVEVIKEEEVKDVPVCSEN